MLLWYGQSPRKERSASQFFANKKRIAKSALSRRIFVYLVVALLTLSTFPGNAQAQQLNGNTNDPPLDIEQRNPMLTEEEFQRLSKECPFFFPPLSINDSTPPVQPPTGNQSPIPSGEEHKTEPTMPPSPDDNKESPTLTPDEKKLKDLQEELARIRKKLGKLGLKCAEQLVKSGAIPTPEKPAPIIDDEGMLRRSELENDLPPGSLFMPRRTSLGAQDFMRGTSQFQRFFAHSEYYRILHDEMEPLGKRAAEIIKEIEELQEKLEDSKIQPPQQSPPSPSP